MKTFCVGGSGNGFNAGVAGKSRGFAGASRSIAMVYGVGYQMELRASRANFFPAVPRAFPATRVEKFV